MRQCAFLNKYFEPQLINPRNFHYALMSMMTSKILKFMDFTKRQKSRYLGKEK